MSFAVSYYTLAAAVFVGDLWLIYRFDYSALVLMPYVALCLWLGRESQKEGKS